MINLRVVLLILLTVSSLFLASSPFSLATAFAVAPELELRARPMYLVSPNADSYAMSGYTPTQIRTAYNLPSTGGNGTIAIIDAYDHPTIINDLTYFSNYFSLPPPNSTNYEEHHMTQTLTFDSGWALETALDVEWAHAIAPAAKILLVQAKSDRLVNLLAAVDYARARPDVVAISMSWGTNEFASQTSYDYHFTSANGAAFFSTSGDNGAGVIWPSSSTNVISVGGTTLNLDANGNVISETAWSGSGGGISQFEPKPSYQADYGVSASLRAVPDVSYNANPSTGFPVYNSGAWIRVGGTSAGAPQWAAIQALGGSASNNNFYQAAKSSANASYFRDITTGSNGAFNAGSGYDYVTGLGSPLMVNFAQPTATPTPTPAPVNSIAVVRGANNEIYYGEIGSPSNSWTQLPSGLTSDSPAAVIAGTDLHIVVRSTDGSSIWHSYVNLNSHAFSGWTQLSGLTPSAPTLTSNSSHLCLVVRGLDNRIYYRFYNVSSRVWSEWTALPSGYTIDSPAAAIQNNMLHVVVRSTDGSSIWHCNLDLFIGAFSGWALVSGFTQSPPTLAACTTRNELILIVRGIDNSIYRNTWSGPNWTGWTALPNGLTSNGIGATATDQQLQIIVSGIEGSSLWKTNIDLSTDTFTGWTQLNGYTQSKPTIIS